MPDTHQRKFAIANYTLGAETLRNSEHLLKAGEFEESEKVKQIAIQYFQQSQIAFEKISQKIVSDNVYTNLAMLNSCDPSEKSKIAVNLQALYEHFEKQIQKQL